MKIHCNTSVIFEHILKFNELNLLVTPAFFLTNYSDVSSFDTYARLEIERIS